MKTIRLTPSQARHHFPIIFNAVTRRELGLPYCPEDARSFDEDLFVILGFPLFEHIPLPKHVRFESSEDGYTTIKNAESLPKEITATDLQLDNSTIEASHLGWDASLIEKVVCDSLTLVGVEKLPRLIKAGELIIDRCEELKLAGPLSLGESEINLSAEEPAVHLRFLRVLYDLPTPFFGSAVIKIDGLELDDWRMLPQTLSAFPTGIADHREDGTKLDEVTKKYVEMRRAKRLLHSPQESEQSQEMTVEVDLE